MKSQSRSTRIWGVMVAGLCVLWFAQSAGAAPLESWDDKIPNANQRFKVLSEFGGAAVLDKETKLVWEQSPGPGTSPWSAGFLACLRKSVGGRMGWRLPTIQELTSLVDRSVPSSPKLPAGHPFNTVNDRFWSATTVTTGATSPPQAFAIFFLTGSITSPLKNSPTEAFWCVRGGSGADTQ